MRNVLFAMLLTLGVTAEVFARPFVFTAIPDEDETLLRARFDKVANYLQEKLGVEVEYVPVKSYASAVTEFRNNRVQLAWFGGLSGVQARHLVPGSQAIAQGYEDQFFVSYFIAHKGAGLTVGEDFPDGIAGKTFTFGAKDSTSGRLMPEFYIREHFRRAPDEVFKKVGFSGNHTRTIALVQSGAYEVGAVNFEVWESELKAGTADESKVSVIWKTPTYPDYQWTIRGDVDETWGKGFRDRVKETLLGITDPDLLASFPRKSFVPADNADYRPIEKTAKEIGLLD